MTKVPSERNLRTRVDGLAEEAGGALGPAEPPGTFTVEVDGQERHWMDLYAPPELWSTNAAGDESGEGGNEVWEYVWTEGRSHPTLREKYGPPAISPTDAYAESLKRANEEFDPLARAIRETPDEDAEDDEGLSGANGAEERDDSDEDTDDADLGD